MALERASSAESELQGELNILQKALLENDATSQNHGEKIKQLQKQLSNSENDRRVLSERLENLQQTVTELRYKNQNLSDQNIRMQNELANNEVQRSGLEAQLRLTNWPQDGSPNRDEELLRQLHVAQRERSEMKGKVDALNDKVSITYILIYFKSKIINNKF